MTEYTIGEYKIIDKIGSGDCGDIFKGKSQIGQMVAIKILTEEISDLAND